MGFDISFHPIAESELKEWYFDVLEDETKIDALGERFEIEAPFVDKYKELMRIGRATAPDEIFDKTHAYYAAVAQGFFRPYFYIRGAAFTFVIDDNLDYVRYVKPWEAILGYEIAQPVMNRIIENYCGGVYIPPDSVAQLLADIETDEEIRANVSEVFSEGTLDVFLKALRYAKEHGLGLLEAAEVIEPNPLDLNDSICYSNLYNCDTDGPLLFAEIAAQQIAEAIAIDNANTDKNSGGFFKRLFKKKG
jgi:hypothetical protein